MKTCNVIGCDNTDIVYSGISALMYGGIPTEMFCNKCANAYNQISTQMKEVYA